MRPVKDSELYSEYEALSRKIGFATSKPVPIPSISVAENLLKLVKLAKSIEAAEAVMKVVRFSGSPKTADEKQAKKICCEASQLARQAFGSGDN